jgi:hypothetical protein
VGLGKAQGFAFIFKRVGVWGAVSPLKVLPLTFQAIYKWNDFINNMIRNS